MRPIRLEVQGLTAYRRPVEIDFTELDLFAITGPTGAGKSSLVDAITYALFGQAPRVGRSIRELISQGEDRLKVSLEFAVRGDRYRIFRESGRKTQKPPQLERYDEAAAEWQPEDVDRVRDTNEFIERLLGMDYEAFIRSVLLPQGEFQEFLAGDRDQRRRVLDGLLRLRVYADMARAANAIAARQGDRAAQVSQRLATELADATPDALKQAKAALAELKAQANALAAEREAAANALRTAEALATERTKERTALDAKTTAEKALAARRKLLEGGEKTLADLDAAIKRGEDAKAKADYDSDLHINLAQAVPLIAELTRASAREQQLAQRLATETPKTDSLRADGAAAREEHEAAAKAAQVKDEEYQEARRINAAALLRRDLHEGDPCPVCGQKVGLLEAGEHLALDRIKSDLDFAREAEKKAQDRASKAATAAAVAVESLAGIEKQVTEAAAEVKRHEGEIAKVLGAFPLAQAESRLKALEGVKTEIEKLEREAAELRKQREEAAKALQSAHAEAAQLEADAKSRAADAEIAAKAATIAQGALREAAKTLAWDEVTQALDSGRDASTPVRRRHDDAQAEEKRVDREFGAQEKSIEAIAANIEKAKELRAEEKQCREEASLAKDLASLLKTDNFPTFIRESALQKLAEDGSRRLLEISGGRYDFVVDGQDFLVEDRWNGGEQRSVKTLSGGETFLASLALALALAEQLPGLAGDDTSSALESLFIDEGFSHLDNETLNEVASALEVLGQDRSRLIGVITHVPALAERMPARITVHKTQAGSSVSVD